MGVIEVTPTVVTANGGVARPAGSAVVEANSGKIIGDKPLEEVILEVTFTKAGTFTVEAGDNPPALEAGQGDLAVEGEEGDVKLIGPLTSGRFIQSDGTVLFDCDAETVTVRAYHVPRTA